MTPEKLEHLVVYAKMSILGEKYEKNIINFKFSFF